MLVYYEDSAKSNRATAKIPYLCFDFAESKVKIKADALAAIEELEAKHNMLFRQGFRKRGRLLPHYEREVRGDDWRAAIAAAGRCRIKVLVLAGADLRFVQGLGLRVRKL